MVQTAEVLQLLNGGHAMLCVQFSQVVYKKVCKVSKPVQ